VSEAPYNTCNVGVHVGDDVAAVVRNRRAVADAAGLRDPDEWVWLEQVHGAAVVHVDAPPGEVPIADGSVTTTVGVPLAVMTADCAPVVVACDDAVGVAHAGHRGLLAGILETTVDRVRAIGHGEVSAFLGPCIRAECYEFGASALERLVSHFGEDVEGRTRDGRPAFDLPAAVRVALARAGVASVDDSGLCTAEVPTYFSYRRDGVTGRQVTVAVLS
jgi:polyphenol oxidase